jgi:hypothetical protein
MAVQVKFESLFYGILAAGLTPAEAVLLGSIRELAKPDFLEDPQIKDTIDRILHPYKLQGDPSIVLQFGVPAGKEQEWNSAVSFASGLPAYSNTRVGRFTKHRVEFRREQAGEIYHMYQLVENSPHLEIFIDNMKLPYAATLWLPLLWFYL